MEGGQNLLLRLFPISKELSASFQHVFYKLAAICPTLDGIHWPSKLNAVFKPGIFWDFSIPRFQYSYISWDHRIEKAEIVWDLTIWIDFMRSLKHFMEVKNSAFKGCQPLLVKTNIFIEHSLLLSICCGSRIHLCT